MSYVVQSCCSIRVRNQLLKMVSDANATMVSKTACRGGSTHLTKIKLSNISYMSHCLKIIALQQKKKKREKV